MGTGTFSKHDFYEKSKGISCSQIHKWAHGCLEGSITGLYAVMKGSVFYFLFMYIMEYLLKRKKISQSEIFIVTKRFTRSLLLVAATFMTNLGFTCMCYNRFGHFNYYVHKYWIPLVSGLCILIDDPHRRSVVQPYFQALAIKGLIQTIYLNTKRSKNVETLIFMFGNAYLMYMIRKLKLSESHLTTCWIFNPPKLNKEKYKCCPHEKSCFGDFIEGFKKYLAFGVAIAILPLLVRATTVKRSIFRDLFTLKTLRLSTFGAIYVGIYKVTSCYLCQKYKLDSTKYAILAGFLSGSAYKLCSNLTTLSTLLSSILMVTGVHFKRQYDLPKLPYQDIALIVSHIYLHYLFMASKVCPKAYENILNMASNNSINGLLLLKKTLFS